MPVDIMYDGVQVVWTHMDIKEALAAFDSSSQDTRGLAGVPFAGRIWSVPGALAGTLSESLNIPHNTLSFHLSHMSQCGSRCVATGR